LIYLPTPKTFLDRVLRYAPLLTPTVGSIAAAIAIAAISAQKSIARKRAAVDFFLKTDLDHDMLDAYTAFETARKKFNALAASGGSVKDFLENSETEKDYKRLRG
jgi:hypothetical protein